MNAYDIIRRPLVTEKSTLQKEELQQLTFEVDVTANRIEIRRAVEKLFNVRVAGVRTINVKGKPKRMGKNFGKRKDRKKAIITLAYGDTIEFFEGI